MHYKSDVEVFSEALLQLLLTPFAALFCWLIYLFKVSVGLFPEIAAFKLKMMLACCAVFALWQVLVVAVSGIRLLGTWATRGFPPPGRAAMRVFSSPYPDADEVWSHPDRSLWAPPTMCRACGQPRPDAPVRCPGCNST